jgi:hypothetical protein
MPGREVAKAPQKVDTVRRRYSVMPTTTPSHVEIHYAHYWWLVLLMALLLLLLAPQPVHG